MRSCRIGSSSRRFIKQVDLGWAGFDYCTCLQCRRGRTHEGNKCGYMLAAMKICNAIAGWAGAGGSLGVELTGLPGIL